MLIVIAADLAIRLEGPADLKRFSVRIDADPAQLMQVQQAAAAIGRMPDAGTLWVDEAWLRQASPLAGDAAWRAGFDAMLGYARKHHWIEAGTGAIRAHAVWAAAPAEPSGGGGDNGNGAI